MAEGVSNYGEIFPRAVIPAVRKLRELSYGKSGKPTWVITYGGLMILFSTLDERNVSEVQLPAQEEEIASVRQKTGVFI